MKKLLVAALAISTLSAFALEYEAQLVFKAKELKINYKNETIQLVMNDGEEWYAEESIGCDDLVKDKIEECESIFIHSKKKLENIKKNNPEEKLAITNYVNYLYDPKTDEEIHDEDHFVVHGDDTIFSIVNEEVYKVSAKLKEAKSALKKSQKERELEQKSNEETKALIKKLILSVGKGKGKKILKALAQEGIEL